MKRLSLSLGAMVTLVFILVSPASFGGPLQLEGPTNPLFKEAKVKNYLPHMSWKEVEEALQETDMVIIPVGSIEQHGKHLPLCSDICAAIEMCKLIAQKADVLVAPAVYAGLSEHHLGFPGSITLTPETFEAVVYETALSLIGHGFKKIMIYNGHGGNTTSVINIIQKINQNTLATAVLLNDLELSPEENPEEPIPFDWHAGEGETSSMLYLAPSLVDMSQAEKPVLTFPPIVQKILENAETEPNLGLVQEANLFRPKDSEKMASSREMSSNGVFTSGDPKNATAERGRKSKERQIQAAVQFIEAWKKVSR
jgi:creatinine amidohydrolase